MTSAAHTLRLLRRALREPKAMRRRQPKLGGLMKKFVKPLQQSYSYHPRRKRRRWMD
jgi:hypothetical protein